MTSASKLVQRYKAAKEAPPVKYVALLRRTMSGHPEYGFIPGGFESPHMFTYKAATNFSLGLADLKILLRNGLMKIQVNDPGKISLYFGLTGDEVAPPMPGGESLHNPVEPPKADWFAMGQTAFKNGISRAPARDPAVMPSLRGQSPGTANKALGDWLKGWDRANLAEPVPGL